MGMTGGSLAPVHHASRAWAPILSAPLVITRTWRVGMAGKFEVYEDQAGK
jgi:hypothetical protein